jgi:hypothetical protein
LFSFFRTAESGVIFFGLWSSCTSRVFVPCLREHSSVRRFYSTAGIFWSTVDLSAGHRRDSIFRVLAALIGFRLAISFCRSPVRSARTDPAPRFYLPLESLVLGFLAIPARCAHRALLVSRFRLPPGQSVRIPQQRRSVHSSLASFSACFSLCVTHLRIPPPGLRFVPPGFGSVPFFA